MSNSIINSYKIDPSNFPLTLYRFEYPGVQTTYVSRLEGFKSASNFTPRRLKGLKNAVEFHMDWSCRTASPFISTLSNRRHAHAWARKWSENHNYEQGFVVTIKIEMHHRVTVFRVADLVNRLGITIVGLNPEQYESEYLCFHHIPPESIVKEQSVSYPARLGYYMFGRRDSDDESFDKYDSDWTQYRLSILIDRSLPSVAQYIFAVHSSNP